METWKSKQFGTLAEAVRLTEKNVEDVAKQINGRLIEEIDPADGETVYGINVATKRGRMARASLGMYVVRLAGDILVMHTRVFEEAFEPVNRPVPPPESIADSRRRRGFADPFGR